MKNPRISAVALHQTEEHTLILTNIKASGLAPIASLSGDPSGSGPDKTPDDGLTKAFQALKFSEEEIGRITELVTTVAAMASVVGWVVAAFSTVKQLLTFMGVLGGDKDPVQEALKAIGEKVQQIYDYLAKENLEIQYQQAIEWREKVKTIRGAIGNLALSRSQDNINQLVGHVPFLQEVTGRMLAPKSANIPFLRATYGYVPTNPPSHWIDAASPFYMTRTTGEGADYRDQNKDLAARIWDPGYYLDVLFSAIAVRTAALAALEPAFRSTGYDRIPLRNLYDGIKEFIEQWEQSFLFTTIVGPIDPVPDPFSGGGHRIAYNPLDPFLSESKSIPLGFIDPVSGLTAFEPNYSDGFAMRRISLGEGYSPYWVVDNYEQAIAKAVARQSAMASQVRARCGIHRAYDLMHSVWSLLYGTGRSEFVELDNPTFVSGDLLLQEAVENLDLGIVGLFAGKPGKNYPARRYSQFIIKKFRIPMARRTDVSKTQLGYKLVVSVGGGQDGTVEMVLCEFSTLNTPLQSADLFPSGTRSQSLSAPSAIVYDVLQSHVFSVSDEDSFEASASVPDKRRIYVNPRAGHVKLDVSVEFEFDIENSDHPFYGFANVEISSVARDANPDGFIAHVEVYETVISTTTNGREDIKQERLADSMSVHFAPSFLVVGNDYFADRDAGYAAMGKEFDRISEKYTRVKADAGPLDPVARVSRRALVEQAVSSFGGTLMHESPHVMQAIISRYQVPTPHL